MALSRAARKALKIKQSRKSGPIKSNPQSTGTSASPNADDIGKAKGWQNNAADFKDGGLMGRAEKLGGHFLGNAQASVAAEGKTMLGAMGGHAVRGAAFGGIAGGSVEAAQGGSFWDGAKQGAFNGAAGWTGYRMALRGAGSGRTGASALNVFGGAKDIYKGGGNMARATSGNAEVSGQARAIMNNRQMDGMNRQFMNQRMKDARG